MATKKEKEKLELLLDWKREGGRLPEQTKLFNRKASPMLTLRECKEKNWVIETLHKDDEGHIHRQEIFISHKTLINLGLLIMDGIEFSDNRR